MTDTTHDDLVKQLQNSKGWPTLGNAAADRIDAREGWLKLCVPLLTKGATVKESLTTEAHVRCETIIN